MKISDFQIPIVTVILVLLITMGDCDTLRGEGIKVGDEVVLASDNRSGKARRGRPAVAFGPTSSEDSVAAGKGIFLVAWQDGWHGYKGSSRIYALRVGLDGKPLDAKAVELAPCKTGVQENPRVAYFKDTFLVVWQDMRNDKDCDVLGTRVSSKGKVLDRKPIAIVVAPRTQTMPDVAADDKGFMVVWHGFQGKEIESKIFARRIASSGAMGKTSVMTSVVGGHPRIAWNGKEHLVVYYAAGKRKLWQRMDAAGKPVPHPKPRYPLYGRGPASYSTCALPEGKGWALVTDGGDPNPWGRAVGVQRAVMVTAEGKKHMPGDVMGSYNPKGGVPPANWLDTSFKKKGIFPYGSSAAALDGQYVVAVWQRYHFRGRSINLVNSDIRASRVDGCKVLDKEGGIPVAASEADEFNPALAGNSAGKLLCAYEKLVDGRRQICARIIETQ
jgi:hypothetical protein